MKLCSPLEEEDGFAGDRTQGFKSSSDRLPYHISCTSATLTRQSTPASKQTSSQTPPDINVFPSLSQPSPETNHKDQGFPSQSEQYQTERKYSPPSCLANSSPALTFRTSSGSEIHKLHPEDQSPASDTTRVRAETSDKANRAPTDLRITSAEATTGKSRRHVCCWKTCGKRFTSQKELSAHVNDDHVRLECPEVDFQCYWTDCPRQGRGFNARYKMLIHIRTHTNEKPHMCVVCRKSFSRLENLKIHTRSHTGERPYSCTFPGCTKAYSNSSDRFKHIRTHQEQKPYKCKMPGCRKQYTDPSSLRKHVRTHRHTPDSSAVALQQSVNSNVPRSDLKTEACSPSGKTADGQNKLHSTRVCELRDYINSVRHHLEKHDLADDTFQTVHAIKNPSIDSHFPNSRKDTEDFNKRVYNDGVKIKTRICNDVLGTSQLIWLDKSMNSHVDIQKSCPSNSYIDQKTGFIKCETSSSRQSPVSTHLYSCDEQLLKKEYKQEENDLTCVNEDLHRGIKKFQTEFTTRECVSLLPTHDLTDIRSLLLYDHLKKGCRQETKMSSCSSSPDLARRCCVKSPKVEHWKKRKLLICEKELQTAYHASTSPVLNQPKQTRTFPVSLNPMPSIETPLHSAVHSNCSIPTSSAPLINSLSPLHLSHMSPIYHRPASLTSTCPQETSRPASELSSSTPLSPPCQTTAPSLYFFHHNQELYYPLFSNWYSPIPTIANSITPPSLHTHNSLNLALSRSPVLPIPTTCHYNSAADHHQLAWNRDYLLPSGSAFSHSECHLPEAKHSSWQHPGFDNLPLLMNVEDTSLLSAASVRHFANSLRLMYQDIPLDLPSLYQSHGCRFPLYLGVHR